MTSGDKDNQPKNPIEGGNESTTAVNTVQEFIGWATTAKHVEAEVAKMADSWDAMIQNDSDSSLVREIGDRPNPLSGGNRQSMEGQVDGALFARLQELETSRRQAQVEEYGSDRKKDWPIDQQFLTLLNRRMEALATRATAAQLPARSLFKQPTDAGEITQQVDTLPTLNRKP